MKTKEQQMNFSSMSTEEYRKSDAVNHIKAKQEHTSTMAVLHFIGSMQAEITVRGNPNIIRKYADRQLRGGIPEHPAIITSPDVLKTLRNKSQDAATQLFESQLKAKITDEKNRYYMQYVQPKIADALTPSGTDALLHGNDVSVGPLFVKVNVFAPNVDFLGNQNQGDLFTNKFFYNGAYMVLFINTIFDGGFKHVINLIPYDPDGSFSNSVSSSQTVSPKKSIK